MTGDAAATREALLDAATKLFNERGFRATTVREIAAAAGVNQALLFRYFGSKQELFNEVIAASGRELLDTTSDARLLETMLTRMLATDGPKATEHPIYAVLRSAGEPESLRRKEVGEAYSAAFARMSSAPDAALRGDLVFAWLLGVGMLHSVMEKPSLLAADSDEVVRLVSEGAHALLDKFDAR